MAPALVPGTVENDWTGKEIAGLASALGKARAVMLGKPTHGSATAFTAKTRLVKLIHEQFGFEAVIWESVHRPGTGRDGASGRR